MMKMMKGIRNFQERIKQLIKITMETGLLIIVILISLLILTIYKNIVSNNKPKWKYLYFFIIKQLDDEVDDEIIKNKLMIDHKFSTSLADSAKKEKKNHDMDWFKDNIKDE